MGPTWGPHGPTGPRWAPCWPHEPCYVGNCLSHKTTNLIIYPCPTCTLLWSVSNLFYPYPSGLLYLHLIIWSPQFAIHLLFSCDQAALWMVQSVRPSVRLSVCLSVRLSVTPFWLCSHHPIIMKFSGVITSDKSDVHAKGQGQKSKVKVTEVTTQLHRFRTVTPVWIHIWDDEMMHIAW